MRFPFTEKKAPPAVESVIVSHEKGPDDFKIDILGHRSYYSSNLKDYNFDKTPRFDTLIVHSCCPAPEIEGNVKLSTKDIRESFVLRVGDEINLFKSKYVVINGILLPGTLSALAQQFPSVQFCYMPVFTFSNKEDEFYASPVNGFDESMIHSLFPNHNITFFSKDPRLLEVIALLLEYQTCATLASRLESFKFFRTSVIFRNIRSDLFTSISEDIEGIDDYFLQGKSEYLSNIARLMRAQTKLKSVSSVVDILSSPSIEE